MKYTLLIWRIAMKKLALLLSLVMMLSLLMACGEETEKNQPETAPVVTEPATPPVTPPETNSTVVDPETKPNNQPKPDPGPVDDGKFLEEDVTEFQKEFTGYEKLTVENNSIAKGDLVWVDGEHMYDSANASDIVRVKDYDSNGYSSVLTSSTKMNFVALRKMQEMNAAMQEAKQVTYLLCIQAGYLTNDELTNLHENYPGEYPEEGGKSDLNTGNAAVISVFTGAMNYGFRNSAASAIAQWTEENAAKYGFIFGDDIGENAKLRYVGVPHATYMKANGLDLAGYLTKLQDGEKIQITDHRDLTWTVYRVAASDAQSTEIDVPVGMTYSISGDNNGGFIVTVKGICQ